MTITTEIAARVDVTPWRCVVDVMQRLVLLFLVLVSVTVTAQDDSGGARGDGSEPTSFENEYDPNIAPSITGTPAQSVSVGNLYLFTPAAKDADGDSLRYSIDNLPHWAFFDTVTGELSGTPLERDIGRYRDISVSVSDGIDIERLASFTLMVQNAKSSDASVYRANEIASSTEALFLSPPEQRFHLAASAQPGALVGTLAAPGYHEDTLSYALDREHAMFSLDPGGTLILQGEIDHNQTQQYKLRVVLSDGRRQSIALVRVVLGLGNGVWQQRWDELAGDAVAQLTENIKFPDSPDETKSIPTLDLAESQVSSAGYRLITYLRPDVSGRYQFALSGGGESQLRIATNHLAVNARPLAYAQASGTEIRKNEPQAESAVLAAGQVYYLEILHRQAASFEPIRVSWKHNDAEVFTPISEHLLYLDGLSVGLVKPEILPFDTDLFLDSSAEIGDDVVHVPALDLQGDPVQFSIDEENLPFSIDQYGMVRVAGALTAATSYSFKVRVSDATHASAQSITVTTSIENALELALQKSDASLVSSQKLIDSVNDLVTKQLNLRDDIRKAVFAFAQDGSKTRNSLNAINWNPSERSVVFEPRSATGMIPLLVSNAATKQPESTNEILAMAGVSTTGARRALLGSNALHDMSSTSYPNGSGNEQMNSFLKNLIAWLLERDDLDSAPVKIVVAHQADTFHFKHDNSTSSWLTLNLPTAQFNAQDVCESTDLKNCLKDADLLIMGQENGQHDSHGIAFNLATTMRSVSAAHEAGLPVLFLPFGVEQNNLGKALLDYFSVASGDNFWRQERLLAYNPHAQVVSPDSSLLALSTTINQLASQKLDFTFDATSCPTRDGTVQCDPDLVRNSDGSSLQESVLNGITYLSRVIAETDLKGEKLFFYGDEYRLEKLALLLADKYREDVQYPMDKHATSATHFMRALFANDVVSYLRTDNSSTASYTDNGFSRTVTVSPRAQGGWYSTGLYAPPGKTIRVRRTDNNAYAVSVRFNRLRTSPQLWNEYGFSRPRNLTSHQVMLPPAQSFNLSTPYGGVIYLWSAGSSQATKPYSVAFDNVLASPKLSRSQTSNIQVFASELATSPSDWVDIETPYAELHTLKSNLEQVLAQQDGDPSDGYDLGDIRQFYNDLNSKLGKEKLALAGYTGKDLPALNASISRFCNKSGLSAVFYENRIRNLCTDSELHKLPALQHFSSDITDDCTSRCAPNTLYSATPITPLDAKLHQATNRLFESRRLLVYGKQSRQAFSQLISLYASDAQAKSSDYESLPVKLLPDFKEVRRLLQEEQLSMIGPRIGHALWTDSKIVTDAATVSPRLAFYLDLIYSQQDQEFLTQLMLAERIFSHAVINKKRWAAVKDALGFGLYSRDDAYNINGNDFIYIASSQISHKTYRDLFQAWGISVSSTAQLQVETHQFSETATPTVPVGDPAALIRQNQKLQLSSH